MIIMIIIIIIIIGLLFGIDIRTVYAYSRLYYF